MAIGNTHNVRILHAITRLNNFIPIFANISITKLLSSLIQKFVCAAIILFFPSISRGTGKDSVSAPLALAGFEYQLQLNHFDISPHIWYQLYTGLYAGAGINVMYYFYQSDRKNQLSAGYSAGVRYMLPVSSRRTFLQASLMHCNIPVMTENDLTFYRAWKADYFIGLGYTQPLGTNWVCSFSALYNLNYKTYSISENRILFTAGIYKKFHLKK